MPPQPNLIVHYLAPIRSAIAVVTASVMPGSYSEWPAVSTMRSSASGHTASSAWDVDGGHSRS